MEGNLAIMVFANRALQVKVTVVCVPRDSREFIATLVSPVFYLKHIFFSIEK